MSAAPPKLSQWSRRRLHLLVRVHFFVLIVDAFLFEREPDPLHERLFRKIMSDQPRGRAPGPLHCPLRRLTQNHPCPNELKSVSHAVCTVRQARQAEEIGN